MEIRAHLTNDHIIMINNVFYNPSNKLLVKKSSLQKMNERYNKICDQYSWHDVKRTLDDLISSIDYAEAPFMIIEDSADHHDLA